MEKTLKPHDTFFKAFRIFVFINAALLYALVFFHRTFPAIVSDDMAKDYKTDKKKLGIFSSTYFWPYAVIQIFAGLLADIYDPATITGISHIVASIGAVICGFSKGILVGCVGRFLIGLGCGPTIVPICQLTTKWFSLKYYSYLYGILLAFGGIGSILSQMPLAMFCKKFGWRVSLFCIAGLGFILALCLLIFCRGNPEDKGYEPANIFKENRDEDLINIRNEDIQNDSEEKIKNHSCSKQLNILKNNFIIVLKNVNFWLCAVFVFLKDGIYYAIDGLWAGPYLTDIYHFNISKRGFTLLAFSFGMILGTFIYPVLSAKLKTRKWVMVGSVLISITVFVMFIIFGKTIPYAALYIQFLLLGMTMNALTCIVFSLLREYYDPSLGGTSMGACNFFSFIGSASFQTISSEIIHLSGSYSDKSGMHYYEKGYRNGIWIFGGAALTVAFIFILFVKDTTFFDKDDSTEEEVLNKEENQSLYKD